jgi:Domain of unknown function (DUF5605)/Domain of unknown function (DUF5060)/Protein of unknown function (DUF4038)
MPYGPDVALADIMSDEEAISIVRHHLPGVLDEPELRLLPFTTLGELPRFIRAAGEAMPDTSRMWRELATVGAAPTPPVIHQAPNPPSMEYESSQVQRASARVRAAAVPMEQWGIAELVVDGPSHGNPFIDVDLHAIFRCEGKEVLAGGFYDGDGTYRVRFHPPSSGTWTFETRSNARSLDGLTGSVEASPPSAGNHGRVIVRDTYHFEYQDGTPYLPLGTTAYAWTHQSAELQESTLRTLADSRFTKVRMCVFPKSYFYNANEPARYPYERDPGGAWDFTRFDVAFFRHLEGRIRQLQDIEVEADLILFHPYDRWGFSQMPAWADELYTKYLVRRLGAFRGVWWSLANEYDFMKAKTQADWEGIAAVVQREDHAGHLTSIHNGATFYDHSRPWITHCSVQGTAENVDEWRDRYRKPVVIDECGYEGDIEWGWGNLSGRELVRRCWEGAVRGGYVNHGETYHDESEVLWWAKGGLLHGESPARIGFLANMIAEAPSGRFEPLPSDDWDAPWGGDAHHRLVYFGFQRPWRRSITAPWGMRWKVDVIDTWGMTVETLPGVFEGRFTVKLPGREYMAVRLRSAQEVSR